MALSQVEARLSYGAPRQSPVFPRLHTGSRPFYTSHPQARAQEGRSAAPPSGAAALDRRATVSAVARLLLSQCNSSMIPAPVAPLGLCFPKHHSRRRHCARVFRDVHEASIASR